MLGTFKDQQGEQLQQKQSEGGREGSQVRTLDCTQSEMGSP